MNIPCHICGLGSFTPSRSVTNRDMEKLVQTSDEWIVSRTGIKERCFLAEGEQVSDEGAAAARAALEDAGLSPGAVTHILTATCTPEYLSPSTACLIADKLGLSPSSGQGASVMCLDFNAACTGFVYGLELARSLLQLHPDAVILLIAAEALSRRVNFKDRSTCVLFGDAAGAVVLRASPERSLYKVRDVTCTSDGSLCELIKIGGGSAVPLEVGDTIGPEWFITMQGQAVFRHAVRSMTEESLRILEQNRLTVEEIELFIPHQANLRIIQAVGERLGIAPSKVFTNVERYGNTSAATLPLALCDARKEGVLKPGMKVLLTSFGGGMTWGSVLLD